MSDKILAFYILLRMGVFIFTMLVVSCAITGAYVNFIKRKTKIKRAAHISQIREQLRLLEVKIQEAKKYISVNAEVYNNSCSHYERKQQ